MPDSTLLKKLLFTVLFLFAAFHSQAQTQWINKFYSLHSTKSKSFLKKTPLNDAYMFMRLSNYVDALQSVYVVTKDTSILHEEKAIIDNVIASARIVRKSSSNNTIYSYLGWTSKTLNKSYNKESALYEGYLFRYVLKTLFDLKKDGWVSISANNVKWYKEMVHFIEKNIWQKWISESNKKYSEPYAIFLGRRTHMAAHWAGIALLLSQLTDDNEIRQQCNIVYNTYDKLLKRNLTHSAVHPKAYTWNCTWDNVEGTQAIKDTFELIQDVSHGNHVLSYVVMAKSINSANWNSADLEPFFHTILYVIYNKEKNSFKDNVDGTTSLQRPGWGNFQADGWLKLGRFSKAVQEIYVKYGEQQDRLIKKYGQSFQYYANLALNDYLKEGKSE